MAKSGIVSGQNWPISCGRNWPNLFYRLQPDYFKENCSKFSSDSIDYWVMKMLVKVSDDPRYVVYLDKWKNYSPFETLMGYHAAGNPGKGKVKPKKQGRSNIKPN